MTQTFLVTLDDSHSTPQETVTTTALRQIFSAAWQANLPAIQAVPGLKIIQEGRFQSTLAGDENARRAVDELLTPPLKTANMPPAPQLV